MIIECSSCNSRFRLDESKITGRGARVRCRKCGEPITVMKDAADAQGAAATAAPGEPEAGLDLRSILRQTIETPLTPAPAAAESAAVEALQSDFEKMMAQAGGEAETESRAPASPQPASADARAPEARARAGAAGQAVDFGPEEELTFAVPGRTEAPAAGGQASWEPASPAAGDTPRESVQAPRRQEPAAPAPSSSEFMMSTTDSLDFLKADYEKDGQTAALDISGSLRVAPAAGAEDVKTAPPLGTQVVSASAPAAEPPSSRSEAIRSELAGLGGVAEAGAAAGAATAGVPPPARPAAPVPPGAAAPPPLARPATAARPAQPLRRPAPAGSPALKRGQGSQLARPSVILLLLLFFALAGSGAYLGFTSGGQKVMRGLVPQIESLWLGGGKPASRYEVGNLIGYYETNAAAGKMFIVKGQLTNEGTVRKVGVRVYAALLDAQNRTLAEKTVYAGNVFPGETLRQATREKIEAAMSNPISGGLANIDLPPGKAVPFMVVFFDAPDGIDSYRLEPRDAE